MNLTIKELRATYFALHERRNRLKSVLSCWTYDTQRVLGGDDGSKYYFTELANVKAALVKVESEVAARNAAAKE